MSAAWVIGLGVAAGYLMQRKQVMQDGLTESVAQFQNAAKPATDGVTTAEIRKTYNQPTFDRDFHDDLPKSEIQALQSAQTSREKAEKEWDAAQGPQVAQIQGVYLELFA